MRPSLPDSLFDVLERQSRQNGGTPAIRTSTGEATFAELYDRCRRHLAGMQGLAGRRVALAMEPCPAWISLAGALARSGAHLFLLSPHLEASRRDELAGQFSFHAIIGPDGEMRSLSDHQAAGLPGVTIFTSGSTGTPKAVTHSWTSLLRPVRRRPELEHSRWMLTYPVRFYSGLQVQLQSLASGGTLTVADRRSAATVCRQIYQENIQYVPATPSFWRWLLAFGDLPALRKSSLEHISLGGEPVSGELLQALHAAFPRARIVHIYATSELGRCFSVTDGQAGFPAEYLARCPEPGVSLRVVDGELQIRSDNAMRGYEGHAGDGAGWIATGDLVDISGGRVRFRGRNTEIINVGGSKVSPVEVETALRRVPGIADLRVYPVASSLAGQLVAADFVLAPGSRAEELRAAIARACAGLPNCQRPRILRFVDRLSILDSGKLDRQSQQESAA
jgi:acyl-CoA synthetase (AMP-forming)/AMP-acid ligase II